MDANPTGEDGWLVVVETTLDGCADPLEGGEEEACPSNDDSRFIVDGCSDRNGAATEKCVFSSKTQGMIELTIDSKAAQAIPTIPSHRMRAFARTTVVLLQQANTNIL